MLIYDNPTAPAAFEAGYPALFPVVFELGTGGLRIAFSDIEES